VPKAVLPPTLLACADDVIEFLPVTHLQTILSLLT
jgi:hypothetical protein